MTRLQLTTLESYINQTKCTASNSWFDVRVKGSFCSVWVDNYTIAQLVEHRWSQAMGPWFESRWCSLIFSLEHLPLQPLKNWILQIPRTLIINIYIYIYIYIYIGVGFRLALSRYLQRKRKLPRLQIVADRLRSVTTTGCDTMTRNNFLRKYCGVCRAQFVGNFWNIRGSCKVYFAKRKRHTDDVMTHNVHVQSDLHRTMSYRMEKCRLGALQKTTNKQTNKRTIELCKGADDASLAITGTTN